MHSYLIPPTISSWAVLACTHLQQYSQCTVDVTLWRVCAAIVATGPQQCLPFVLLLRCRSTCGCQQYNAVQFCHGNAPIVVLLPTIQTFLCLPVTRAVFLSDFDPISVFCTNFRIVRQYKIVRKSALLPADTWQHVRGELNKHFVMFVRRHVTARDGT